MPTARRNLRNGRKASSPNTAVTIMPDQQKPLITKKLVLFGVLFGLALMAFGAIDLAKTIALHRSKSVAVARVVESRQMIKRRGGVSFEIRYAFSPAPGSPEIGRADFLGRTNLWSPLPEPDWLAATATNQLKVRFDPGHPGNNAPDVSLPKLRDSSTAMLLGVGFCVSTICAEVVRRRQLPAEAQSP